MMVPQVNVVGGALACQFAALQARCQEDCFLEYEPQVVASARPNIEYTFAFPNVAASTSPTRKTDRNIDLRKDMHSCKRRQLSRVSVPWRLLGR